MRIAALPLALLLVAAAPAPSPDKAAELRNLGIAQLENEQPALAEATFRELAKAAPSDALPLANLAISLLRQQKNDAALKAIDEALAKAPGRADLLAIRGDVLQWSSKAEEALSAFRQAAAADPNRVEVQFSLYQQASALGETAAAQAAVAEALGALTHLRPENLVVLLKEGQRAIRAGDRTAATMAFLRIKEILGPAPAAQAVASLGQVMKALETNDLAAARIPAVRLENVLKVSLLYQQSLRELSPGIQSLPVERFAGEPPATTFGDPLPVRFRAERLPGSPTAGRALALGDFDGDGKIEIARVADGKLELRMGGGEASPGSPAPEVSALAAADLDNDGNLDLIGYGAQRVIWWRGIGGHGKGRFEDATAAAGLNGATGEAIAVLDYDLEGDLDLVLFSPEGKGQLYRNALSGPLESVGAQALPGKALLGSRDIAASDLDRDGDVDLAVAHGQGIAWLDNQRQGRFADRTAAGGLAQSRTAEAIASADLDNDGRPDLVTAGAYGLNALHNRGGSFEPWPLPGFPAEPPLVDVIAFDADNDGRLDLATAGPAGVSVLAQRGTPASPSFEALPAEKANYPAFTVAAADLDGDGDLDLVAAGPTGLQRIENDGGNRNHWLTVRLRGLTQGNSKNNILGLGAVVEVRAGAAYQFQEVAGQVTHLGLGRSAQPDLLRVVWTNGVPQNRIQPKGDQRIVEQQILKGSCPFVYAWNGERFELVTDLLWNAPIGMPIAPGVWMGADPGELVRLDGLVTKEDRYELRLTEELWEATFFDSIRLWVVDHPAEVEVASNLKVVPGSSQPEAVLASRDLQPMTAAWDGAGEEATTRIRERDEIYASGFAPSPYQGVAAGPWTFTFDLGQAPGGPVRLHLDGWVFPADASLNLALAQRNYVPVFPRLEVETNGRWEVLLPMMGFPAGKTKTMVVDTPPLPPGAHRLRIVTSQWLAWDRMAWTTVTADAEPKVVARLAPDSADLRFRGFSELKRRAPNAPHWFDYQRTSTQSPWLPFPGRYTRYGDVRELLLETDDRSVILAPGDEIAVVFDAAGLPPVQEGWTRTLFLESDGWDKDADRNTYEGYHMEPLPFRSMKQYGEPFPETPELKKYVEEWLTREVSPE